MTSDSRLIVETGLSLMPTHSTSVAGHLKRYKRCARMPASLTARHHLQMGLLLGVAQALLLNLFVSVVAGNNSCQKPRVRREWRSLELDERADWIRAVNVCVSVVLSLFKTLTTYLKCLADLPHDPKVVPSVPANVSLIPPVNTTSSFYDGMQPRALAASGFSRAFCRSRVFAYGPQCQGMTSGLCTSSVLNDIDRSTGRDYSSHGTDISSNSSKMRS
jgi:hypothetical protein